MASAGSLYSEEQLLCSICLDVFTDPITTPCGHNFCKACITRYWGNNNLWCPLCRSVFYDRPEVRVNTVLSDMADQFRKSQQRPPAAEPDEVSCDICSETMKLKALKSCLACQISFCETHLEPHYRVTALKKHKLINPVKNLEDCMCKKHGRPVELFCRTDHVFVCQFCTESDHRLHQIVSLEEECEGKKAELRKTEAEVQQMIQERQVRIQEVKCSVELIKKDTDKEMADTFLQFSTTLISCIENRNTKEKRAEGLIKELEKDIAELQRKSSELKQLSHTEDHLHLLQNFTSINTPPPTQDWTKAIVHQSSYGLTMWTAVAQLRKTLMQEMEKTFIPQFEKAWEAELRRIQQYPVDVTLDPDSAHCELTLSDCGKQVQNVGVWKDLQYSAKRFSQCPCVLGKQCFSGRSYYEVQVKGNTAWRLGVVRESINRKVPIREWLTPSKGYWVMELKDGTHMAHAGPTVFPRVRQEVQTVGVFVDHEEGLVSFFDAEARVHIYSFTGCTFTEKLFPYFSSSLNYDGKHSAPLIISPVNHTDCLGGLVGKDP